MRRLRIPLIFVFVLAMCAVGWTADTGESKALALDGAGGFTLADFEKSVTEFTLANGMKFIVVERHQVPVVAFDLRETRVSAGDASVYVPPTGSPEQDVRDYAKAIVDLIDDAEDRERMGKLGRVRVEEELAWSHSATAYLGVYQRLTGGASEKAGN